ncbi:glycosyltransferase family 32 protein [Bifidobacterium moukalabense]|uniref:glycosyltransferase family 32 protein n=1 Tax=Bifidobacterium moukalabense TaxID=1333651 RepID=UPI0010F892F2|nr:glycosyltransferase [Bifidobacterium moukalabense]
MLSKKIIHYCWFGGNPLSKAAKKSIASWKKYAPEYTIQRWDENNTDLHECAYALDAYHAKKWAFVSDYIRFKAIYEYGGIYMDVGSELIRPIGQLEDLVPFSAIEMFTNSVNPGLILAANAGDPIVEEVLNAYQKLHFEDTPKYLSEHTVNDIFSDILVQHGLVRNGAGQVVDGWNLLPPKTFNPVYGFGGYHISKETISVHRYSSSWGSSISRLKIRLERRLTPFLGRRFAQIVSRMVAEIKINGLGRGTLNIYWKIREEMCSDKRSDQG